MEVFPGKDNSVRVVKVKTRMGELVHPVKRLYPLELNSNRSDSIVTFEEILKIAESKEVDFILLGGDLFHENKPSRKVLHDCISLMRKYCMGDRAVQFEFLSDQSDNFKHCAYPTVNFEDPNYNISIPIFSIHGNHDDPAGAGLYCSLDLLSVTGLVNYFGKCTELENVNISPLMLQKGKTKLCMYGLGSIRDERLHRMYLDGKVTMLRPKEKCDEWFNLMVVHQNRTKHGPKNYLPEQFLDNFLDLVVWGHEHECRIDGEWNDKQAFFVTQPGSSVATSLCHGEAVPKHVGLLQIRKKEFQITKIPLQTVRQFYIKDVDLEDTSLNLNAPDSSDKVIEYCRELVDQFLAKAEDEHTGHPKQPQKPLIRLRVFCPPNFETFSVQRFGQSYVSRVANPKDIIHFSRRKSEKMKPTEIDAEMLKTILKQEGFDKQRVEDLVKKYFEQTDDTKRLLVLSEIGVSTAVQEYVDKDVKEAISTLVDEQVKKTQNHLKLSSVDHSAIDEELQKFREERRKNVQGEVDDVRSILQSKSQTTRQRNLSDSGDEMLDEETVPMAVSKTRGRGRGRGSRGGGRGGRSNSKTEESTSSTNGRGARSNSRTNESTSGRASTRAVPKKNLNNTSCNTSKRKGRQTDLSSFFNSTVDDDIIELSDEDEIPSSKRRKLANQTRSKRGVVFDLSD
ncbi:double-strand break repair protein MRE11 [Trichonephila clavipes]|nr:double-strand break repair protein MRE11 [Trichonephila clavipes]